MLRVIDASTVAGSAVALWLLDVPAGAWAGEPPGTPIAYGSLLALTFVLVAGRLSVYHARRTDALWTELMALLETALVAMALSCLALELTIGGLPPKAYAAIGGVAIVTLLGLRTIVRVLVRRLRRGGKDYRTWLIVGRNARSARIANDILSNPHYGIRIAAVLDLPSTRAKGADPATPFLREPLSTLVQHEVDPADPIARFLSENVVDEVVISLPLRSCYDSVSAILSCCHDAGVSVKFPAESFDIEGQRLDVMRIGSVPLVTHYSGPSNHFSLVLKRVLDLGVSALGLVLFTPVFAAIALAIKLTSPGPVLFRQTRVGLNGRLFTLRKFRTMVADASAVREHLAERNEADGPVFKIERDPRVTPVGRFLRKYHLDELPQLFNVLFGDMSLVGPRPPVPEEIAKYEWWQRRRLSMQPGLTCLWQVKSDHRMPFQQWMELDLEYIDRWSFMLDLRLLLATVGTVLRGRGW